MGVHSRCKVQCVREREGAGCREVRTYVQLQYTHMNWCRMFYGLLQFHLNTHYRSVQAMFTNVLSPNRLLMSHFLYSVGRGIPL